MPRIRIEDLPVPELTASDEAAKVYGGCMPARRARASVASPALSFRWTQLAGPQVVLSNPSSVVTTFVTPNFSGPRSYRFSLFVDS